MQNGHIMTNNMIKLSKSSIGEEEKKAVENVLNKEYLGMGSEVEKFENNLSEFFQRPCVCVSSGTAALQLAMEASGIANGDEVLVQSITYVASFQAISATGAKPVACDINPKSITIDLSDAGKRITHKTKAIMPVHYSGGVGDLDEVYDFAKKYNLRVIEDAAHAFGTLYKGKRIGSFGDLVCFSFDGIKNITSGEGGCVVTENTEFLQKLKDTRLLGVEKDTDNRFLSKRSWQFDVKYQGWRYHMSNIMAAIGVEQLKKFPNFAKKRKQLANIYNNELKSFNSLTILENDYDYVVPHIYPVILSQNIDRKLLQIYLRENGVETGIHYQPNHKLTYYKKNIRKLEVTEKIYSKLLTLPLHTELAEKDIIKITNLIKKFPE